MTDQRVLRAPRDVLVRFLRTTAETAGAYLEFETTVPAGVTGPPAHLHLAERESFRVVEGELAVKAGRYWRLLGAGEDAVVEPGTAHTFANRSAAPARFVVRMEPPGTFEELMRMYAGSRLPPVLRMARVHHGDDATLMLAGVPIGPQRLVWNGLAGIARLIHPRS
jgi:mannose-6-phosphate isomerase-like protein (cupin superfamily)